MNVLNRLTYGVFILTSKHKKKASGCVINTCMQISTNPDRIIISLMNSNYTRDIIKDSGVFCVAILDEGCPLELIKHFGYQSGKKVDKFKELTTFDDINGVPCVLSHVCAAISAKVIDSVNLGSHTIFIGKVMDQKLITGDTPMTYSYYQDNVKPKITKSNSESVVGGADSKSDSDKGPIVGWRCIICGFVYKYPVLPDDYTCEVCGHPASDFVPIYSMITD